MSMYWKKLRRYETDIYYARFYVNGDTHRLELVTDGEHRYNPGNKGNFRNLDLEAQGFDRRLAINFGFFGKEPSGNGAVGYERAHGTIYHNWKTKGIYEFILTQSSKMVLSDVWPNEIESGYPNANFVISGGFTLVMDGKEDIRGIEFFSHYDDENPRTWVDYYGDGWFGVYVAEGRSQTDDGLTAEEMARISLENGALVATSGDGGGSSIGLDEYSNVVNEPSDGTPRAIPNMLVYYVHKDHIDEYLVPEKPDFEIEENQYILLLMEYIRFSQGRHGKGHSLDLAGKDTGKDILHAPFDLEVKRVYDYDNTVWAESLTKVWHANGTYDYATVQLTHANTIAFHVGQRFQQGEAFYPEGMKNASGNHIHADIAVGKFVEPYGWEEVDPLSEAERIAGKTYTNMKRGWRLRNSVDPEAAWNLLDGYSTILDLKDVNLKVVDSMTKGDNIYEGTDRDKEKIQYQNLVDRLRVREQANPDSNTVGYLEKDAIYSIDSIRIKLEGEDAWTTFAPEWGDLLIPDQDVSEEVNRLRVELADCVKEKDSYKEQSLNQEATIEYLEDFVDDQEVKLAEYEARIIELEKQLDGAKEDPERPEIDEDTHNFLLELLKKLFQ